MTAHGRDGPALMRACEACGDVHLLPLHVWTRLALGRRLRLERLRESLCLHCQIEYRAGRLYFDAYGDWTFALETPPLGGTVIDFVNRRTVAREVPEA